MYVEALRVEEDGRAGGVVALGVDKDLVEVEADLGERRVLELVELVLDLEEAGSIGQRGQGWERRWDSRDGLLDHLVVVCIVLPGRQPHELQMKKPFPLPVSHTQHSISSSTLIPAGRRKHHARSKVSTRRQLVPEDHPAPPNLLHPRRVGRHDVARHGRVHRSSLATPRIQRRLHQERPGKRPSAPAPVSSNKTKEVVTPSPPPKFRKTRKRSTPKGQVTHSTRRGVRSPRRSPLPLDPAHSP